MSGSTLRQILLVGTGGFVGSTLRFAVGGLVHRLIPFSTFPWGTLLINAAGCFAIGLLAGLDESRQLLAPEMRLLLMIGLLGGFTTYSTFGLESLALLRDLRTAAAIGYIGGHLVLGLGAVWLGMAGARAL